MHTYGEGTIPITEWANQSEPRPRQGRLAGRDRDASCHRLQLVLTETPRGA